MRLILYLIGAVFVVIVQTTLVDLIAIIDIKPDVVLLYVIFVAVAEKRVTATLAGFGLGVVEDLAATGLLGLSALAKSIAGFVAHSFRGSKGFHHFYEPVIIIALTSLVHDLLIYSLLSLGSPMGLWRSVFAKAFPSTLYNIVIGLMVCTVIPKSIWNYIQKKSNVRVN